MSVGVLFILFVIFLIIAIPVGITLGITAVLPHIFDPSFTVGAKYLIRAMFGGLDSFPLLAVPMFVLSGIIMAKGGISRKIFDVFAYFFGRFTAGMPCAVIVTCLFYGAISGSAPATVAAVGSMTAPILIGMGYDKTFTTSVVAVAGGLGVIIPPSIPFIMYGMASGASVSDLFLAGIIPGLVIAALLMGYAICYCKRNGEDRVRIEAEIGKLHEKGFGKVFKDSFWALLSPIIVLGCIYSGVTSPTEAAVISVYYALIVSLFIYKEIKFRDLRGILVEAIKTFTPHSVYTGGLHRILQSADVDAGAAGSKLFYSAELLQQNRHPVGHQRLPASGGHGDGYHTGDSDSHADSAPDCTGHRHESDSVRCNHGGEPGHRLRHPANRRQPVRG